MTTPTHAGLERWFSAQGPPQRIDLARSGASGLDLAELLALTGISVESVMTLSLDYGPGEGDVRLREAIAKYVGLDIQAAENIVVTHGAIEALLLVCLATTTNSAGRVLVAAPAYSGLLIVPATAGRAVRCIDIWTPERGWSVDSFVEALSADTELAIINSPHNPTGVQMSLAELDRIARRCAELDVMLVVDEVGRGTLDLDAPSAVKCAAFDRGHMVVIGDVSKAMGLGGLRIGWLATANRELLKSTSSAKDATTVSNGALAQHLASVALENATPLIARVNGWAQCNRAALNSLVHDTGGTWTPPSDGLVGFPDLAFAGGSVALSAELLRHDVSVVPGSLFGCDHRVRLGLGCPPPLFAEGLQRIGEVLAIDKDTRARTVRRPRVHNTANEVQQAAHRVDKVAPRVR